MVKFLVKRTSENSDPTWNHDPGALNHPTDRNNRVRAADVQDVLTFSNPIIVSQSDHYKERAIREQCWQRLVGNGSHSPDHPGGVRQLVQGEISHR